MFSKVIFLTAITAVLAHGNGRAFQSTKNVFQKQAPQQSASVTSYHSSQQAAPQVQAAPSPYSFGYEAEGSARQESSDASGKVTGSYTVTNEDGSTRVVKYVADEQGFRADIDTNEPGTKSDNPANVALKSSAVVQAAAPSPVKYASQGSRSQSKSYKKQYEQKPVQNSMGSNSGVYSYNYQTQLEDGGSNAHSESSDGSGKVTGYYSMSVADGRKRKVDYSASNEGFQAKVDTNEFGTKSDSPAHVQFMSSAPLQGPAATSFANTASFQQQKQVKKYSSGPVQQQPIQNAAQFDTKPSPYAFSYDAQLEDGSSSRTESADASGKVIGSYSLSDADGRKRTINYEADHEGFRATVDTNEFGTKSDSPANVQFYSSAAQEASPAQTYGAGKISQQRVSSDFPAQQSRFMSSSQSKSTFQPQVASSSGQFKSSYQGQSSVQYNAAAQEKPSPYSFNYLAQLDDGSSSRSESSDESGKVIGSYSLSVADGRQRTVDYTADHEGFKANVNTNEFGTKGDSPADVQFYSSATFDEPAPYSSPNAYKASASGASKYSSSGKTQQQAIHAPFQYNMGSNGAYSYNYESQLEDGGSNAHSENSDGSGKVSGYYSMSVADGRKRKVDYTADNGGFQAKIDTNEFGTKSDSPAHVQFYSSAPQEAPRAPVASTASQSSYKSSGSASLYKSSFASQQKVEPQQSYQPSPYSFNYEAEATGGSSARKEASDASGTVTGSYTVRNEDGSVRVVEYIADKDGFRANVNTNEPGTKSDHPADVVIKSDAPVQTAPVQQRSAHHAQQSQHSQQGQFPARTYTQKSSMVSQKAIDGWRR